MHQNLFKFRDSSKELLFCNAMVNFSSTKFFPGFVGDHDLVSLHCFSASTNFYSKSIKFFDLPAAKLKIWYQPMKNTIFFLQRSQNCTLSG